MMNKILTLLLFVVVLIGCAYEGEKNLGNYLKEPKYLIKDPHFESYKDKRDSLESQYLSKQISYADYVEKLEELDNKYDSDVQRRDSIIAPQ